MTKEETVEVLDLLFMSRTRVDSNLQDANIVDALFAIADAINRSAKCDEAFLELEKEKCKLDNEARAEAMGLLQEEMLQ